MQEVDLDQIVSMVVDQVVEELEKRDVKVVKSGSSNTGSKDHSGLKTKTEEIDMSKYKSPILSEKQLRKLHELTGKIIIPERTVITPKAKEYLRDNNIKIGYK